MKMLKNQNIIKTMKTGVNILIINRFKHTITQKNMAFINI